MEITQVELDRFWAKIEKTDGCWNWTGGKTSAGYGMITLRQKNYYAHRFMWMLAHKRMPTYVMHICDNPACVNPEHLLEASHRANLNDAWEKGRLPPPPTLLGEDHPLSILTAKEVREIRKLCAEGNLTQQEIGELYGTDQTNVSDIKRRKSWKHLEE